MQSQLSVVLFADIVGYSALMEQDQARTVRSVRSLRDDHLRPVVDEHGGTIMKSLGDGWIVSFASVAACVDCATAFQNRVQRETDMKLRVGCHIGEIVHDDEDLYGSGLNIAQRVQAEAPPGGIMVSEDVFRQLSGARAARLNDAGMFRLKNIAQPARLYQWRPERQQFPDTGGATSIAVLPVEFAPKEAETEALASDLRDQLLTRMSRRTGVVIYDAGVREIEDATYDLRSRLRVAQGRGRLSLTLILRADGRPVWSQTYQGETADIFRFCDVILERAEGDLRLQTNAFDGDRLAQVPEAELSVSELRARAANCFYRVFYDDWAHGLRLMNRALEMNATDAVALAMRAEAEMMLWAARYADMPDALTEQLAMDLDLAVEHAPGSDYVFWSRSMLRVTCLNDPEGAASDLEQSRRLNPAYVENHEAAGHIRMYEGAFSEAADQFSLTLERQAHNPLIPYRLFLCAVARHCAGDQEAAAAAIRQAIDIRPRDRGLRLLQVIVAEAAGQTELADRTQRRFDAPPLAPSICSRRPVMPPG